MPGGKGFKGIAGGREAPPRTEADPAGVDQADFSA